MKKAAIFAVHDYIFKESNPNSLVNIHERTKKQNPKQGYDLYTMLCNSMNNSVPAVYTTVIKNEETGNYETVRLVNNTVDRYKATIENNIINSATTSSIEKFINDYNVKSLKQTPYTITLNAKDYNGEDGVLTFVYTNNRVESYIKTYNGKEIILHGSSSDPDVNKKAIEIIKNNSQLIKDSILMNLPANEKAFESITANGGAMDILSFVGATILSKQFAYEIKN